MKEEKKLAANSNNVYGIIEIYHRSNTHNASIYHHFFSPPLVFQKFKYFTNLIKTLYLLRTVDFEIYNVEKKMQNCANNSQELPTFLSEFCREFIFLSPS